MTLAIRKIMTAGIPSFFCENFLFKLVFENRIQTFKRPIKIAIWIRAAADISSETPFVIP